MIDGDDASMQSFVYQGLSKILRASSRRHKRLREECSSVLDELKALDKKYAQQSPNTHVDNNADKYFLPFKLACETTTPKLRGLALDTIQKLIAYGYLTGHSLADPNIYPPPPSKTSSKNRPKPPKPPRSSIDNTAPSSSTSPETETADANGSAATAADANAANEQPVAVAATASSPSPSSQPSSNTNTNTSSRRKLHRRRLIDVIIETIYDCSMFEDDNVQLQVIKALLTSVSSVSCQVHEHSLLMAVRACYHIYLMSRSNINKSTAKATLTQMLNIVFQRMEHFSKQVQQMDLKEKRERDGEIETEKEKEETTQVVAKANGGESAGSGIHAAAHATATGKEAETPGTSDGGKEERKEGGDGEEKTAPGEKGVSSKGVASSPSSSSSTTTSESESESAETKEGELKPCVVCKEPAKHTCTQTKDPVCGMECKVQNFELFLEKTGKAANGEGAGAGAGGNAAASMSPEQQFKLRLGTKAVVLQNDAFLLFRALCKLSTKSLPDPPEPLALRSNTLALELLFSILDHAGPTFRSSTQFLALVKDDLVMSLLKNLVTPVESIFRLSSSIFITLTVNFKASLKAEMGLFINSIFLNILNSPNSTYAHKMMALNVLSKICQDPQVIVDVFVNYDCDSDPKSFNIFTQIAEVLAKIAQGRFHSENWMSGQEKFNLRLLGLESMVSVLRSLLVWTQRVNQQNAVASAAAHVDDDDDDDDEASDLASVTSNAQSLVSDSTSLTTAGAPSAASDRPSFTRNFALQKERLKKIETAVLRFNIKPKKGLAYLHANGVLAETPEAIAEFFLNTPGLDKTQLGEYMGEGDVFNKQVMHRYTESLDFKGLPFDDGIRKFVNGFRLPGEGQKIDRMMEKFAEQYCKHNPGRFSSAEAAYVLAYAVIMLNTDAHSTQIRQKNKMTLDQFLSSLRGIDDGKDLDRQFLIETHNRIINNEIVMDGDPCRLAAERKAGITVNAKKRFTIFKKESEMIVRQTRQMIKSYKNGQEGSKRKKRYRHSHGADGVSAGEQGKSGDEAGVNGAEAAEKKFFQATEQDVDIVEPMFEIVWYPALATFSLSLEEIDNSLVTEKCFQGYRDAISIAAAFHMDIPRHAFVSSLKKFTLLGSGKKMKEKNVDAIALLLSIAHAEGNNLKESWADVLECISKFDELQLGTNRPNVDVFEISPIRQQAQQARARQTTRSKLFGSTSAAQSYQYHDNVLALQIHILKKVESKMIDKVFTQSARLNSEAIVDFVEGLKQISQMELTSNMKSPRVFSLQKIVEITYYNMGRIRLVWRRVWNVLSDFFIQAGCHPNLNVSMYAIDSLRQLAMKFLEKDELANFQFQKQFLKPFERIMAQNPSTEVRELIIQCLERMILARVNNVKSGWKCVLVVLTIAAKDAHYPLVETSYNLMNDIMGKYFSLLTENVDNIDECVNCLIAFGDNIFSDISLHAVQHLGRCADYLGSLAQKNSAGSKTGAGAEAAADANVNVGAEADAVASTDADADADGTASASANSATASNDEEEKEQPSLKVWFLILTGLSRIVGDVRVEVRSSALQMLFKILLQHGHLFTSTTWRMVFRGVLVPIFDDVRHSFATLALDQMALSLPAIVVHEVPVHTQSPPRQANGDAVAGSSASVPVHAANASNGNGAVSHPEQARSQSQKTTPAAATAKAVPTSPVRAAASAAPVSASSPSAIPSTPPSSVSRNATVTTPSASRRSSKNRKSPQSESNWLQTTCLAALMTLVKLFSHYHSTIAFLLPDVLELINSCIDQESEDLCRIGIKCWLRLLETTGGEFSEDQWTCVFHYLSDIYRKTLPSQLYNRHLRQSLTQAVASASLSSTSQQQQQHSGQPQQQQQQTGAPSTKIPVAMPVSASKAVQAPQPMPVSPPSSSLSRLPPNHSALITKCRVQLMLMDATFQLLLQHFPTTVEWSEHAHSTLQRQRTDVVTHALKKRASVSLSKEAGHSRSSSTASVSSNHNNSNPTPHNTTGKKKRSSADGDVRGGGDSKLQRNMTLRHVFTVLDCLMETMRFARGFNADLSFRRQLRGAGYSRDNFGYHDSKQACLQIPDLFFHQTHATNLSLQILLHVFNDQLSLQHEAGSAAAGDRTEQEKKDDIDSSSSSSSQLKTVASRLIDVAEQMLADYSAKYAEMREWKRLGGGAGPGIDVEGRTRWLGSMEEVVCMTISQVTSWPESDFVAHLPRLYPLLVSLVQNGSDRVRSDLAVLFATRISKLLKL